MAKLALHPIDRRLEVAIPIILDTEYENKFMVGRGIGVTHEHLNSLSLPLADKAVSAQHCLIEYEDGSWYVTDQGSRNGTIRVIRRNLDGSFAEYVKLAPYQRHRLTGYHDEIICSPNDVGFFADATITSDIDWTAVDDRIDEDTDPEPTLSGEELKAAIEEMKLNHRDSWIDDLRQFVDGLNKVPLIRVIVYGLIGLAIVFLVWGCVAIDGVQ